MSLFLNLALACAYVFAVLGIGVMVLWMFSLVADVWIAWRRR